MNRKKIIDWITYLANMLVALPIFGMISCAVFWLGYQGIFLHGNPPVWAQLCVPLMIDLMLIVLWGRYQYRIMILKKPRPPHETRRNLLILAGCIVIAFLLIFGLACYHKAERMKQAGKLLRSKQKNTEQHDSIDIKKILLHNNDFIKKNISCIEVLYCKKSSLRDNSGWNVILKINTADIDFSKLTLLDSESKIIFINWLRQTDFFAKNTSFLPPGPAKLYRPSETDEIGFPAVFCKNQKSFVFLYNSKL